MEEIERKSFFKSKAVRLLFIVAIAFLAGYFFRGSLLKNVAPVVSENIPPTASVQKWTCSMHPQIIRDKPGKCPICAWPKK
jgi:Cu(I)/Ag(I) efflux system membrane fusion protein